MGRDDRESELGGWQLELKVRLTSLYMGEEDQRGVCPCVCVSVFLRDVLASWKAREQSTSCTLRAGI